MLNKTTDIKDLKMEHLDLVFDPDLRAIWVKMKYPGRPCISPGLLEDLQTAQKLIGQAMQDQDGGFNGEQLKYQILSSSRTGVFNLGGDLGHFIDLIRSKNRAALFEYAKSCIDILHSSVSGYGLPITSIALVQGETLGGGFEAALSANVIIAERGTKFGFPETVFGLFPGMGAFSFLARRLSPGLAKRIIASGKVYDAEELYEMGVIDMVVPEGRGVRAVHDYIQHQANRVGGFQGLEQVIDQFNPVSYKELLDVVTIWVDTAMRLSEKNLRLMEYLLNAQEKRWVKPLREVASAIAV
jgi:DSF synthase